MEAATKYGTIAITGRQPKEGCSEKRVVAIFPNPDAQTLEASRSTYKL